MFHYTFSPVYPFLLPLVQSGRSNSYQIDLITHDFFARSLANKSYGSILVSPKAVSMGTNNVTDK